MKWTSDRKNQSYTSMDFQNTEFWHFISVWPKQYPSYTNLVHFSLFWLTFPTIPDTVRTTFGRSLGPIEKDSKQVNGSVEAMRSLPKHRLAINTEASSIVFCEHLITIHLKLIILAFMQQQHCFRTVKVFWLAELKYHDTMTPLPRWNIGFNSSQPHNLCYCARF